MTLDDIGLGAALYDTPQEWYNALEATFTEEHIGECLAEEFTGAFDFQGKTSTATLYAELRAKAGAEHDGSHHALSGLGNARINFAGAQHVIRMRDDGCRMSWMEIQGPGANNLACIQVMDNGAGSIYYIHHNIFHNDGAATTTDQSGIITPDADARVYFYRNIVFGVGGTGIRNDQGAANSVLFYNTAYGNNRSYTGSDNSRGGLAIGSGGDANYAVRYNAIMRNWNVDIRLTRGVQNYNYSADTSAANEGANSVGSVDPDGEFVNAIDISGGTPTWSALDLRLVSGATMRGAGVAESAATYPEIDVPINDRSYTITGSWDIGAAQYIPPAGGGGANPYYYYRQAA